MKYFTRIISYAILLCACSISSSCDKMKESMKEEMKEEMKKEIQKEIELENLKKQNEEQAEEIQRLKEEQKQNNNKPTVTTSQQSQIAIAQQPVVVPNKVKIHDADNAGVVLRTRPSDATKMTGSGNPHFFTGYVFECIGVSGNYYKVYFDGGYYFIPKRYASPYNGADLYGPMSW